MAKRLMRDTRKGLLAGVAAGFADYFDVDPIVVRLVFILLTLLHGVGALFYLVCWLIMPKRETEPAGAEAPGPGGTVIDAPARSGGEGASVRDHAPANIGGRVVLGLVLIALGTTFLLERLDWLHWPHWLRWSMLWPSLVIAIGVAVIVSAFRRRAS